jgi:hypothetical protein
MKAITAIQAEQAKGHEGHQGLDRRREPERFVDGVVSVSCAPHQSCVFRIAGIRDVHTRLFLIICSSVSNGTILMTVE